MKKIVVPILIFFITLNFCKKEKTPYKESFCEVNV